MQTSDYNRAAGRSVEETAETQNRIHGSTTAVRAHLEDVRNTENSENGRIQTIHQNRHGICLDGVGERTKLSVFVFQQLPYREMYPNATPAEWKRKIDQQEKKIRILELVNPKVNVSATWGEEEQKDESSGKFFVPIEFIHEIVLGLPSLSSSNYSLLYSPILCSSYSSTFTTSEISFYFKLIIFLICNFFDVFDDDLNRTNIHNDTIHKFSSVSF